MSSVGVGIADITLLVDNGVDARARVVRREIPARMLYVEGAIFGHDLPFEDTVRHRTKHTGLGITCENSFYDENNSVKPLSV